MRANELTALQIAKLVAVTSRLSDDNVGGVKHVLSLLARAPRRARHLARVETHSTMVACTSRPHGIRDLALDIANILFTVHRGAPFRRR